MTTGTYINYRRYKGKYIKSRHTVTTGKYKKSRYINYKEYSPGIQ